MNFISPMSSVYVRKNINKFMLEAVDGKDCFYYSVKFSMSLLTKIMFLFAAVKNKYTMMRL